MGEDLEIRKEFKQIYLLEAVLFVIIIVIGTISYATTGNTAIQIYLYMALVYFISWFGTIIIVQTILAVLKNRIFNKPKKARVFEYTFFLGLFWATAILTDAYSQPHNVGADFLKFLDNFGAAMVVYGIASVCGWYHYILRLDD